VSVQTVSSVLQSTLVQWTVDTVLAFACSGALDYDVCWGYVDSCTHAVADSLTGFLLSPAFYCEKISETC
jgi:hypothetical protein